MSTPSVESDGSCIVCVVTQDTGWSTVLYCFHLLYPFVHRIVLLYRPIHRIVRGVVWCGVVACGGGVVWRGVAWEYCT